MLEPFFVMFLDGCALHKRYLYIFNQFLCFFLLFLFSAFMTCCLSDPGVLHEKNIAHMKDIFPYDDIMYKVGVHCATCKEVKPARSKHCSKWMKQYQNLSNPFLSNVLGLMGWENAANKIYEN